MTNENCLAGIACPKCGQEDRFLITALITCLVTDDGSEPQGDHYWDDTHICVCAEHSCEYQGELAEFRKHIEIGTLTAGSI